MEKHSKSNKPVSKQPKDNKQQKHSFTDPGVKTSLEIRKEKNKSSTNSHKRKP